MSSADAKELLSHTRFLKRLVRSLLTDETRVDDVVQQTWLAALKHRPRSGRGLRGWLATVARNFARQGWREEGRRQRREQASARPEALPSTADAAERLALQRKVVDAVLTLEEPYRNALLLRYLEDLSVREVAARSRAPVATVKTRLRRGLQRVRRILDAECGDRRAWCLALLPFVLPDASGRAAGAVEAGAGGAAGTGGSAAMAIGALTMQVKAKWALVAVVLLSIPVVILHLTGDPDRPPRTVASTDGEASTDDSDVDRASVGVRRAEVGRRESKDTRDSSDRSGWTLGVRVRDAGGQPVQGAQVRFLGGVGDVLVQANTSDEGRAALDALGPGVCIVSRHGYAPILVRNLVPPASGRQDLELELSGGLAIGGIALAQDGRTPARITVRADPIDPPAWAEHVNAIHTGKSGPDGRFRIGGLLPGRYKVRVYVSRKQEMQNPGAAPRPFEVNAGDETLRIALGRTAQVQLRLVDAHTGEPIYPSMEVRAHTHLGMSVVYAATIRRKGPFDYRLTLTHLPGTRLQILAQGYAPSEPKLVDLTDGEEATELTFELVPSDAHEVVLTLICTDGGKPLDRILVTHKAPGFSSWSGRRYDLEEGRVAIKTKPGAHVFKVGDSRKMSIRDLPFPNPLLTRELRIELRPGDRIEQIVEMQRGGWVLVNRRGRFTLHGRDGTEVCRLRNVFRQQKSITPQPVAPGSYRVRRVLANDEIAEWEVEVRAGETSRLDLGR